MFISRILAVAVLAVIPLSSPAVAAGPDAAVQRRVDAVLAKHGGQQISANQVRWADGGAVTTVQSPDQWGDPSTCAYGNFCVYTDSGYGGDRTDFLRCETYPYSTDFWSYVNNQTGGTRATLISDQGSDPVLTPGAWHGQFTWNGLNYSAVKPC
ncbi:hypothetical protein HPO96_09900 [Kribbella sandramycini]|uniref:Peptidase inhibitor family I36 n=1 Tax=Kribbella sandramycini TaxID=60450 RepID=A0A7Y4KZ81_9ACTN|nr:hypothetical protein [Kribbella sandramycini]MBB6569610.1 hypothetical protein [Kribbella sandramycini]NOL40556.1 hypothetical protein [Kribbella sandramycini]